LPYDYLIYEKVKKCPYVGCTKECAFKMKKNSTIALFRDVMRGENLIWGGRGGGVSWYSCAVYRPAISFVIQKIVFNISFSSLSHTKPPSL
jgi:hypothetical protein